MKVISIIDPPLSAEENMNKDKSIFYQAQELKQDTCIVRIYEWSHPSITLGASQNKDILNMNKILSDDVQVAKRLTGGKAVYHRNEVTYSISAHNKTSIYSTGLYKTYRMIAHILNSFLNELNIHSNIIRNRIKTQETQRYQNCFNRSSLYEINIDQKKIIGSAQKRSDKAFLQHGSIPLEYDQSYLNPYLNINDSNENNHNYISLNDFIPKTPINALKQKLMFEFKKHLENDSFFLSFK